MSRQKSQRVERLVQGLIVGAAVGVLAAIAAIARPGVLERGEFWTYDQRARAAADRGAASPDIVIIEITEQDLEDAENNYGVTWPWPRAMFGYLATYAKRAGAKAIVFDWLFQDRGQYSVTDAEEFAVAMRDSGIAVIGLALTRQPRVVRATEGPWAARLGEFASTEDAVPVALQLLAWNTRSYLIPGKGGGAPFTLYYGGKKTAADVLTTWQRLVSAEELQALFVPAAPEGEEPAPVLVDGCDCPPPPPEEPLPPEPTPVELAPADLARELTIASVIAERDGLTFDTGAVAFPLREGMDPPLAPIAAAPAHTGNVYQDIEADGIMRRYFPLVRHGDRLYPSLAVAAYLVAHPEDEVSLDGHTLRIGDRRVPLDDEGKVGIRFHGVKTYRHVRSFEVMRSMVMMDEAEEGAVLDLPVPLEDLRGKYLFVSASGQAMRDVRVTPVSKIHEGAEIQATALDNLEAGSHIVRSSKWTDGAIAFFLALLTAIAMVLLWSSIPRASLALLATSAATVVILVGLWQVASWLFRSRGLWIGIATPALGVTLAAFAALLVTSAAERRGRRFVQEALGKYTSKELVRELMAHPEYLSLEWGERRPMSVYFSDIAGFTSFSEVLTPERLVALLNDYLTNMTDIVLQHGGVVDKYIGDAVMAFWGAPLPDASHGVNAVRCAIAMRKRCDQLRPVWKEQFGSEVRARAGVNSGNAVVGNMGSKHKYNYTVMGDMVNLASRLEGANKPYGTYLMISEFTLAELGDRFDVRELDLLAVKGKEQPVRVYEVFDEKGKTDPTELRAVARYEEGLVLYRARDFAVAITSFEAALSEKPDDGPSLMYIDRCRHFLDEPPEEDWDGVWRLAEK